MKKVFFFCCCYLPILMGCAYHEQAILAQLFVGLLSFWAGVFILFLQTDIMQYKRFSLHQFIGAAIGYVGSALLYLSDRSNDVASQVVMLIVVLVGLAIVAIQVLIGLGISKCFKRNKNNL